MTPQKLTPSGTKFTPKVTHPFRAVYQTEHKANILFIWPPEGKTWKKTVVGCVMASILHSLYPCDFEGKL